MARGPFSAHPELMVPVERVSEREIERRLVQALRGRKGRLTRSDAAALTGLPFDDAASGLDAMLATYRSHLAATESGELLYAFDPALTRRDAEPLRARLERAASHLWRFFVLAFKVAIITVLVVYFLVFVVLLLGLFVAQVSGRRDGERDDRGGGVPLWVLWWLLPWDFGDPYGRAPARRVLPRGRQRKKAYQQVFNFVFGPSRPGPAPGEADRQVLTYLRAHQGRITAVEVAALRGLDLDRAEEEATRLMCEYDGEPEVTDEAVVVYVFRELRVTAGVEQETRWSFAWERLEERAPLIGNSALANGVIGAVNGFNLLAPLWLVPAAVERLGLAWGGAEIWLRVVPLAFSSIFFAVPLGRALARVLREPGRLGRNRWHLFLRAAFLGGSGASEHELAPSRLRSLPMGELVRSLAAGTGGDEARLQLAVDRMIVRLGGDVVLDETAKEHVGEIVFPRLRRELDSVRGARAGAPDEELKVGAVVFDSAKELDDNTETQAKLTAPPRPARRLPSS
jgi:hypothetical protein